MEARLSEMTMDVREKDLEIMGLRDDMAEMRQLYRSQLDSLLEEKATETVGVGSQRIGLVQGNEIDIDLTEQTKPEPEQLSFTGFGGF
mmetsp:Transcript_12063/g.17149  ORF Transcript_12063/g.17149 Transcript_12063/m.17149 type:complete len:88 (+) Transcript_12063:1-264(+)